MASSRTAITVAALPPPRASPTRRRRPLSPEASSAPRADLTPGGSDAPPAPSSTPSLSEEVALLQAAQQALKHGDGTGALTTLGELGARHPDGALREERLTLHVLGLCAAGRVDEAREAGRRFVAEMPGSVQAERVRASCAFAPSDRPR